MVNNILKTVYGTTPCGQLHYSFQSTALHSMQEATESFLENMWGQLEHMIRSSDNNDDECARHTMTLRDVQLWKRAHDFKLRFKKNDLSLCEVFESHK